MSDVELRRELALACRILAAHGQGDAVYGHVSVRSPGAGEVWMKPARIGLDEATPDGLVLIDLDGNVLGGDRPRHHEYPIHTEIMRRRPEISCVVHTHPRFGIALPARGLRLLPIGQDGSFFWPGVPVFSEFTHLVLTRAQGESVAAALGSARAIFLRNHGVAVAGRSVAEACVGALMLERACEIQLLAQPDPSAPVQQAPPADAQSVQAIRDQGVEASFDYYARSLGG
jgi:ribulose-5-phosphate 4-epimerase/fuculose-1-phosphate aldolase